MPGRGFVLQLWKLVRLEATVMFGTPLEKNVVPIPEGARAVPELLLPPPLPVPLPQSARVAVRGVVASRAPASVPAARCAERSRERHAWGRALLLLVRSCQPQPR